MWWVGREARQRPAKPYTPVRIRYPPRAIGAGVARFLHTEEVTGSIPVSPTSKPYLLIRRFFIEFSLNVGVAFFVSCRRRLRIVALCRAGVLRTRLLSRWISSGCRGAVLLCKGSIPSGVLTGWAELFACLVLVLMGRCLICAGVVSFPRFAERSVSFVGCLWLLFAYWVTRPSNKFCQFINKYDKSAMVTLVARVSCGA